MKNTLSRIMGILLATTLLVGVLPVMPTTASLEVPSMEDVIIAQANTPYKAFFPDVVLIPQDKLPLAEQADYPNGKLLVAFYRNDGHVPSRNAKEAMGTIQMVESKDNGRTWSDSRMVLNTEMLMEYGIGHENYPMEARDPNFAILSDGTVIFTFFVRNMNTDSTTQAYITYSCDGGKTFAAPTLIPTALLDAWYAKRGDIAVFSDDQMLIPIYGQGSAVSGQAGVNILCTLQADGTFRFEGEYLLADSGTLGGTINEVSLVATEDDTVYAMAREMGYVWKSTDRGVSWECIGKETVIGGTQMHQPGLKLLDDGSIFATWTVCNTSATGSRPVYAKRFFPELGWDATDAKLVYRYDGPSNDMGDPSSCVLPNGEVLVLYYVTADATVKGTFVQPDEMLEADAFPLEASERGQAYTYLVENYDALSLGQFTHSKFELITPSRITVAEDESGRFMRFAGNKPSGYNWGQVYSYDKLAGDYTATFDFRFSGATASGETEEAYVTLLHLGGVTAMCHIRQNEILYKIDSAGVTAQKDKNFTPGEWYSLRISRAGDGLYVRAWKKGTPEPAEWDLEQHHNVVKTTTGAFRLAYLSSNPTDKYFDVDNLVLSRRSVGELNTHALTVNKGAAAQQLSVTFTPDLTQASPAMTQSVVWASTDTSVATVDNGKVAFADAGVATVTASTASGEVIDTCEVTVEQPLEASKCGQVYAHLSDNFNNMALGQFSHSRFELITPTRVTVAEDESGRFMRFAGNKPSGYNWGQLLSYDKMAGDYTATFDFRFNGATASGETEEAYVTLLHLGGVTAMCHIRQNEILYKIDSASVTAQKDKNFTPGEWYSLRISRAGDGLYVRAWKKGKPEPAEWDLEQHHNIVKTTTGAFRLAYLSSNPTDKYFDVDNLVISRRSVGELNTHTLTATTGDAARQLSVTFTPDLTKATPSMTPSVVWTSTDASVATVNNGEVAFVGAGTATVTASTALGEVIDSCAVTVAPKPQLPNTAVVNDRIITVKPADGYELKAGSLLVKDANGNYFVPERVGYRDGGDASQYEIPAEAKAPYTLPANDELFYQPTADALNMNVVGVSTTENSNGGLRFVYRLNVTEEGGKLYMLSDGAKVEVAEYGLLLAAEAIVKNPEDLDIETAKDSMHVHQFAWPEANKYFDKCADYVDIAVHVVNICSNNGAKMNLISRAYVKLANGDVVYTDTFVGNYSEYAG